jgi:hypothetical protein
VFALQGLDGVLAVTTERLYFCPIVRHAGRGSTKRAPCGPDGPKMVLLEEVKSSLVDHFVFFPTLNGLI